MRQVVIALLLLASCPVCVAAEGLDPGIFSLMQATTFAQAAAPDERPAPADPKDGGRSTYTGGRGLITIEGITGLFLNPTSGTPAKGQLTPQYCVAITEQDHNTQVQHTAMLSYGVTDWLELGVFGRITSLAATDGTVGAAGPLVRVRLLKDEQWWPELAVGALDSEGDGRLTRRTLFTAASKGLALPDSSPIRSVRAHVGVRQLWQDEKFNAEHVTIGYVGGEIELPAHVFVVG